MTGRGAGYPDVLVVGDGLIGLASALALADAGFGVIVVGSAEHGQASHAAAGMLAPGVEREAAVVHAAAVRARDRYPTYVAQLEALTGVAVPLNRRGILQLALDEPAADRLRLSAAPDAIWLSAADVATREPALAPTAGALLHAEDGAIDNRQLMLAVRAALDLSPHVVFVPGPVRGIELRGARTAARLADGGRVESEWLVLAAGAWSSRIDGLPRALPVEPVRGQMLLLGDASLAHVVYGAGGYAVPRGDATLVGSTMERVGFDSALSSDGLERVHGIAVGLSPRLARAAELDRWAGLRPMTPDGLPILGVDPLHERLVYACGHSRNGVLLAAITGDVVAALIGGTTPPIDVTPFAPRRFQADPA